MYILPKYLTNVTQPIGTLKATFFAKFVPVLRILCMLSLKFVELFCFVFMRVFRVFVRQELWVDGILRGDYSRAHSFGTIYQPKNMATSTIIVLVAMFFGW